MTLKFAYLSLLILMFSPFSLQGSKHNSTQQSMIQELEAIKYNISLKYAPIEIKKKLFGWELESAFGKAKKRILTEKPTIKDYHNILNEFFGSLKDYHVNVYYYSTEKSFFPFSVSSAKGRYFITGIKSDSKNDEVFKVDDIDLKKLTSKMADIHVGDEIIAFDGVPIKTYLDRLIAENVSGDYSSTGYAYACKNLFSRLGKYGQKVPKGMFKITLRHFGETATKTYELPWFHVREWVNGAGLRSLSPLPANPYQNDVDKSILYKDFSVEFAKDLLGNAEYKKPNDDEMDVREKSFLTPLGEVTWETKKDASFYAYIYTNSKGRQIGYIYLSKFGYIEDEAYNRIQELISIIKRMNAKTDALVIDINNNPGGNILYMYATLSLLSQRPLKAYKHRETLISEDAYKAAVIYNEIKNSEFKSLRLIESTWCGLFVGKRELKQFLHYYKGVMKSWERGEWMTPPSYSYGINQIMPNPAVQYTKPIVVLTNEYCFSSADIFPGILQDNKRAVIFGAKTAGAGGYVKKYSQVSQFGIQQYSLTGSIVFRLNGEVIENAGITPDVLYDVTVNDIQKDYRDYKKALNDQIDLMLKG